MSRWKCQAEKKIGLPSSMVATPENKKKMDNALV